MGVTTIAQSGHSARSISACDSIDEVKSLASKAEAFGLITSGGLAVQNRTAEIKIRAERRAGELIRQLSLARGRRRCRQPRLLRIRHDERPIRSSQKKALRLRRREK